MVNMDTKSKILLFLEKQKSLSGGDLAKELKISRQALNRHLQELLKNKTIQKTGSTKGALYHLTTSPLLKTQKYPLKNLEEDKVFHQFIDPKILPSLTKKVQDILYYVFTEMLNNAIDHSKSQWCWISLYQSPTYFIFSIQDAGIGIFNHIQKIKHLDSPFEACEELLKGKCTTDPTHHTGEGIFFTSKAVDYFSIESNPLKLTIDNELKDYSIKSSVYEKGTSVFIKIHKGSKKSLKDIFDQYTTHSQFSKTRIYIKLFERGKHFISRSEAKRLLLNLEKFKTIILDFQNVTSIGQAFADEIFRVYQNRHLKTKFEIVNANNEVQFMIRRAKNPYAYN